MHGTVRWFDITRGYGFIAPASGNKDVFVHITNVQRAGLPVFSGGEVVEFDVVNDKYDRLCATNLRYRVSHRKPQKSRVAPKESHKRPDPLVCDWPIAQDWYKLAAERVRRATNRKEQDREATRATLEVVTRRLLCLGWKRLYTSPNGRDRRAESRYLQSPHNRNYQIRISNHQYPGVYSGHTDFIITREMIMKYRVAAIVGLIDPMA